MDNKIGKLLVQAIENHKWLEITYINEDGEKNTFWIAVYFIYLKYNKICCYEYNGTNPIMAYKGLYLDNILTAKILDYTYYNLPNNIDKEVEDFKKTLDWTEQDKDINKLFDYYEQCNWLEADTQQKKYLMVKGVDINKLCEDKSLKLDDRQFNEISKVFFNKNEDSEKKEMYELAILNYGIEKKEKLYVICYYKVILNPYEKELIIDETLRFNKTFIARELENIGKNKFKENSGEKVTLSPYVNMNVDDFIELFRKDEEKAKNIIRGNLDGNFEKEFDSRIINNTQPQLMVLEKCNVVNVGATYKAILERFKNNSLNEPLKSFLGERTERGKSKQADFIILDNKMTVNQSRVLYNAMKQPVTFVQGPPGTGKTQSILNIVFNGFYNNKTMLICSSNNKPVDDIINEIEEFNKKNKIPFPYLRLGNNTLTEKVADRIKGMFEIAKKRDKLSKVAKSGNPINATFKNILERQEKYIEAKEKLDVVEKLCEKVAKKGGQLMNGASIEKKYAEEECKKNPEVEEKEILNLLQQYDNNETLIEWMNYSSLKCIQNLNKEEYRDLIDICNDDTKDKAQKLNDWLSKDENMENLVKVFPIIFTTNISTQKLGTPDFMFDLVVMDEAGQCNVSHSLIPIAKATSLLLVGDIKQLKPIVTLERDTQTALKEKYIINDSYDYKHSVLEIMQEHDQFAKRIMLNKHFRCPKNIIAFINEKYYDGKLDIKHLKDGELILLNVSSNRIDKNTACEEANEIIKYIEDNDLGETAIITPFCNQRALINKKLKEKNINGITCNTIHSMQGGQADTVIISLAITQKTTKSTIEWLKNNTELINVGFTRAKKRLIVACDVNESYKKLKDDNDLKDAIEYVENNGNITVKGSKIKKANFNKSNGSISEKDFYKTMEQFCSCYTTYNVKRNVDFKEIFKDDDILNKTKYHFDCVLYDSKTNKPKIAIELNGLEHYTDEDRITADKRKMEICTEKDITFIGIPNSFSKDYQTVANIIEKSKDTQTQLFLEPNKTINSNDLPIDVKTKYYQRTRKTH